MRNLGLAIFLALVLISCAPDDEDRRDAKNPAVRESPVAVQPEEKAASEVGSMTTDTEDDNKKSAENASGRTAEKTPEKRISPAEYEEAGKILQYANHARELLEENVARPAAHMRANMAAYLDTWHLGRLPKMDSRKTILKALLPPEGLFSQEEEKKLARALDGMDKALSEMTAHYLALDKYVRDASIKDDGARGSQLGSMFEDSYRKFAANSHSWLEIVEKRAEEAEEKFLRAHPLQRQIAGARDIFAQFRELAALVNSGSADTSELASLGRSISQIAEQCGQPPFNASPALERLYRNFLAKVELYCKTLNLGLAEGMHDAQKRELNETVNECRKAYNDFVRQANFLADNIPGNSGASRENGG